jgi:hypothetical protein
MSNNLFPNQQLMYRRTGLCRAAYIIFNPPHARRCARRSVNFLAVQDVFHIDAPRFPEEQQRMDAGTLARKSRRNGLIKYDLSLILFINIYMIQGIDTILVV